MTVELALLFRWRFLSCSYLRIKSRYLFHRNCWPHVKMLKAFFQNFQAPLCLVRLDLNYLEGRLVIDRMGGEISKMPYCVNWPAKSLRIALLGSVSFKKVNFHPKIYPDIPCVMKNILKAPQ